MLTIEKFTDSSPFHLDFHALNQYGAEMEPAGPVSWDTQQPTIVTVPAEPADPVLITLTGVVGTCYVRGSDGVAQVKAQINVSARPNVESGADVTETP